MQCGKVMETYVLHVRPEDPGWKCAQVMRDEGVGFLPVVDEQSRVLGVITDRDLVVRIVADGQSEDSPASALMHQSALVTCRPDEDLHLAEHRMAEAQKERIVVVDGDQRCVGVISLSTVAQHEKDPERLAHLLKRILSRSAPAARRGQP